VTTTTTPAAASTTAARRAAISVAILFGGTFAGGYLSRFGCGDGQQGGCLGCIVQRLGGPTLGRLSARRLLRLGWRRFTLGPRRSMLVGRRRPGLAFGARGLCLRLTWLAR
jgi:hypothetical protein